MLTICFVIYKLRFVCAGIAAIIISSLVIWLAVAIAGPSHLQAGSPAALSPSMADMGISDSPNAVTNAITGSTHKLEQALDSTSQALSKGAQAVAAAVSHTGVAIGHGAQTATTTVVSGMGSSLALTARTYLHAGQFVARIPENIFGAVADASVVNAVIRPAEHSDVPIIDPRAPEVQAAKEALPAQPVATAAAVTPSPPQAVWPIHGMITTPFGVPEWPYQAVHTGLDISDGKPAGTTAIVAFRHGTVITAERSGGLGNHVVIDHGSGVTSVYGHLNSITVSVGQMVDIATIIGYEGTTGVSTGPHLHFEIRVNGQATDPHQFIVGQP